MQVFSFVYIIFACYSPCFEQLIKFSFFFSHFLCF